MPSFIWPFHCWKDLAAYPLRKHCCLWTSRSHPRTCGERNLHGISACKVYPRHTSLYEAVGSYPTFSPLPRLWRDGYFLWHCLYQEPLLWWPRLLTGALLYAVRTFLHSDERVAMARPVARANLQQYNGSPVLVWWMWKEWKMWECDSWIWKW